MAKTKKNVPIVCDSEIQPTEIEDYLSDSSNNFTVFEQKIYFDDKTKIKFKSITYNNNERSTTNITIDEGNVELTTSKSKRDVNIDVNLPLKYETISHDILEKNYDDEKSYVFMSFDLHTMYMLYNNRTHCITNNNKYARNKIIDIFNRETYTNEKSTLFDISKILLFLVVNCGIFNIEIQPEIFDFLQTLKMKIDFNDNKPNLQDYEDFDSDATDVEQFVYWITNITNDLHLEKEYDDVYHIMDSYINTLKPSLLLKITSLN